MKRLNLLLITLLLAFAGFAQAPGPITGIPGVCAGQSTSLSDAVSGGTWTSTSVSVATIDPTGLLTGVAAGTTTISYTTTGGTATVIATVAPAPCPSPVFYNVCVGSSVTEPPCLSGIWSSSDPAVANVGSTSGIATGNSPGTAILTITAVPGCLVSVPITVNPTPATIGGIRSICSGTSSTLLEASSGGTWTSSNNSVASINPIAGVLNGGIVTSADTSIITYTLPTGCFINTTVTVSPVPPFITGILHVCAGSTTVLGDGVSGGSWSCNPVAIATINLVSGAATGVAPGTATITYTLATGCTTNSILTVNLTPGPITGTTTLCAGGTTTLSAPGSGTWTSSNTAVATVLSASGSVHGVSPGTATVSYSLGGTCVSSAVVTVNSLPVAYPVTGGGGYCSGGSGVPVGLTGSAVGTTYQLMLGGTAIGSAVAGTGGLLDFGFQTIAGTYTIIATSSLGCSSVMTGSATVSINPLPTVFTVTGGGTFCVGGTGFDIFLSGSSIGTSYRLYNGSSPIGSVIAGTGSVVDFGTFTLPGTYTVVATFTSTACTRSMSGSALIAVSPLPTRYSVTGGGGYCAGSAGAPVGLSGSESGITYELFNGLIAESAPIFGTGLSLDFGPQTTAGSYIVIATDATTGCIDTMSGSELVTVNPLPSVYSVTGGGTMCTSGTGLYIDLAYSNTSIAYQLFDDGAPIGSVIPGFGGVIDFGPETAPGTYTVMAIDVITGCSRFMADSAVISVVPAPAAISGPTSICQGSAVILSDSSSGGSWSSSNTAVATIGLPGSVEGRVSGTATITYSLGGGCLASVVVTVSPVPTAFTVTGSGTTCAGSSSLHIGLSGSATGVNYQLFSSSAAVGPAMPGTGFALDFGPATTSGTYSVTGTGASGCLTTMAGGAVITVYPLPNVYHVSGGGTYCAGSSGLHVSLDGSDPGISYQLSGAGIAIGLPLMGTGSPLDFGLFLAGSYTVAATNGTTFCASDMSGVATITATPLPVIHTLTGGGSYCLGGSGVSIGLSSSNTGTSYQLYLAGSATGAAIAGTGAAINFGLFTAAGSYIAVATNGSCPDTMAGIGTVTISSLPVTYTVTGGGSYCSGGAGVHIGLSGSNVGINYQVYVGTSSAGSAVAGTGAAIDFGAQTLAGVYTIVATNSATTCTSNMTGTATITIIPSVTPSVTVIATPGDTVCAGTTVDYSATVTSGGTSAAYSWAVNGVSVGAGGAYSYVPANGDVVSLTVASTATCASPSVVTGSATMNVFDLPAISGGSSVCSGSILTLTDTSGGIWNSSNPAVATIATVGGAIGVVSGVGPGTTTISYSMGTACSVSTTLTVHSLPVVSASSASSPACGGSYTLTAGGGITYTWAPSTGVACATCSITDVLPDTTTTYYVTGTDADGCRDTAGVTVDGNRISGSVSLGTSGTLKVWLIQFNPLDSSVNALDSTTTCTVGSTPYYEFDDKPAGNYMVKAFLPGGTPGTSGYVPTYGLSSAYWNTATSIAHTGAANALNINMIYGTVPAGTGFIGGLISSGAGRGTSTGVAEGMLVYLVDAISNQVLTYAYTDSTGAYSFSNIAFGSYIIYPEEFGYTTIPSGIIILSSSAGNFTSVDFRRHTLARTITPATPTQIINTAVSAAINIFPNPASNMLNVQWENQAAGNADIVISDVVGREVYRSAISINGPAGQMQIDLKGWKNGIYLVTVKSENIDFKSKLVIQ